MTTTNSKLELNRADYEEIFDLPNNLVIIISAEGKLLKTNATATRLLGWDAKEILGMNIEELIFSTDRTEAINQLNRLVKNESEVIEIDIRCLRKNGGYLWVTWKGIAKDNQVFAIGSDATGKIETEKALIQQTILQKEYQTRFHTFFEQSTLPMQILSLAGTSLAVNKAWEEVFCTTREGLAGYNILQDPQLRNSVLWKYLQRAYSGEAVEVPAFWYDPTAVGKKGRPHWLEAWISPVKNENGIVREIAMIVKDVTDKIETQKALVQSISERKAAEEKFQIISDRLSMAVKAGNIGIWEWIPGTNHIYWDETTERIYGFELNSFNQDTETFSQCIHPADQNLVWDTKSQSIKDRKSYRIDHRIIRKDGILRWVQSSGMAIYDDNGFPYHMMGTIIDITDRVQGEEDQKFLSRASEILAVSYDYHEILKNLCDHAINYFCDGVMVDQLLPDGGVKRLMLVHSDQVLRTKLAKLELEFPEDFESLLIQNIISTGKTFLVEDIDRFVKEVQLQNGREFWENFQSFGFKSCIGVRLKGRESILGMISFFTMKKSHRKLTKRKIWLAEELSYRASMAFENALIHQSSREAIRSRDEFLSIASHELKTPLQSLTLQNQMRKRNLDKKIVETYSEDKIRTMIEADLRHLMRINRLIDDMLDISRIRAGKLTFINEKVQFCSFIKEVLERFRPQLDAAGCIFSASYSEEVIVEVDIYRTEQVIVNLLSNALKYGAAKPIKVNMILKENKVQLQVIDQGPGIRKDDAERVFERFERATPMNEVTGLGLGLYISRKIMQQNNGALYLQSTSDKGSTFIIELPFER